MSDIINVDTGCVLWQGESAIDGSPCVAIATFHSENEKTGDMIQTWIIRSDIHPVEAVNTGGDRGICGDCPHRGDGRGGGRSCYVTVGQAPGQVYATYRRGGYPNATRAHLRRFGGRMVRLGAYGDPTVVPFGVWMEVLERAVNWTGYTHQWRTMPEHWRRLLMASCDSVEDFAQARANGWRTFRVKRADEENLPGEFACPSSPEGGNRMQCIDCMACNGTRHDTTGPRTATVAISVHGSVAKVRSFNNR